MTGLDPPRLVLRRELLWALVAALISLGVAAWILDLASWTIGTPFSLEGDGTFVSMQLRDVHDHGWYWNNPDLGFPYGQNGARFPELNVLHMAVVKVLGAFASDPYTPGVVYFVAGFPLAAVAMFALARAQGIDPRASAVVGVLFSLAPGHQERFGHLWLASYWTVPLGVWVVLHVMQGRRVRLLEKRSDTGRLDRTAVLLTAAMVAIGLSGVYYVAFTMILLLVATVVRRWAGGPRDWLPGIVAMATLIASALVPLLFASFGARDSTSTGDPATRRSPAESEVFAGKAMDLLLPWEGHRVDLMAYLTSAYKAVQPSTVETAALGLVAVCGSVGLVIVALRSLTSGSKAAKDLRTWAVLGAVAFAFYTIGGLGSFTAVFFTPQVRTWSRLSLFIMLFALLAVGWWLSRLLNNRRGPVGALLCLAVLGTGILDQTNHQRAPDHEALAAELSDMRRYGASVGSAVGPDCAVFQLPVVSFPESAGTELMNGYDPLLPYLASNGLKWSAGAMRGTTEAEWQLAANLDDVDRWTSDLAAAGFCAVEVNANGFDVKDDPRPLLQDTLGPPIAVSHDGVFASFRLPSSSSGDGEDSRLLQPVIVSIDGHEIRSVDGLGHQWVGPRAQLRVANLSEQSVRIAVRMYVDSAGDAPREVTLVDGRGNVVSTFESTPGRPELVELNILASPGTTIHHLKMSGTPTLLREERRTVFGEISGLKVTSPPDVRAVSLQEQVVAGIVLP